MIYTMFSVFTEDSPQQVRRNMVQWVNDNKQKFESQTILAFTAKDSDLDMWLSNIDNNSTLGDEFALLALCQMYTRHTIIVTSNQTWTSVHPKHKLDNQDLSRKCDLHLIYLGGEAFGILKPKFEWKVDVKSIQCIDLMFKGVLYIKKLLARPTRHNIWKGTSLYIGLSDKGEPSLCKTGNLVVRIMDATYLERESRKIRCEEY